MTTIDRLDLAIHVQYARRTEFIEAVRGQYHLEEADRIPAQAMVVDIYPRVSEMDLLLGVARTYAPWAYFFPPKRFFSQRRTSFSRFRVAPTLGSLEDQDADAAKVAAVVPKSPEEAEEKELISKCLSEIENINELIGFVIGRIGQFLQG